LKLQGSLILDGHPLAQGFLTASPRALVDPFECSWGVEMDKSPGVFPQFPGREKTGAPLKVTWIRKFFWEIVGKYFMFKKHLSAILGKNRCNLLSLAFLRAFTDIQRKISGQKAAAPWDSKHLICQCIKHQLKEVKRLWEIGQ
jgi:hypothetical protein